MADSAKKQANPIGALAGIAGAVGGYALASYSGANLLIPGVAAVVIGIIAAKALPADRKVIVPALAVQGGHLVWLALAGIILNAFWAVALDVMVLGVGLVWLAIRPGLGPILVCGIYQLFALILNVMNFSTVQPGSVAHRALLVHILLRVTAIALLGVAARKLRQPAPAPPEISASAPSAAVEP